jgi:hypothetical protein
MKVLNVPQNEWFSCLQWSGVDCWGTIYGIVAVHYSIIYKFDLITRQHTFRRSVLFLNPLTGI